MLTGTCVCDCRVNRLKTSIGVVDCWWTLMSQEVFLRHGLGYCLHWIWRRNNLHLMIAEKWQHDHTHVANNWHLFDSCHIGSEPYFFQLRAPHLGNPRVKIFVVCSRIHPLAWGKNEMLSISIGNIWSIPFVQNSLLLCVGIYFFCAGHQPATAELKTFVHNNFDIRSWKYPCNSFRLLLGMCIDYRFLLIWKVYCNLGADDAHFLLDSSVLTLHGDLFSDGPWVVGYRQQTGSIPFLFKLIEFFVPGLLFWSIAL